jgi:hypothetical protein
MGTLAIGSSTPLLNNSSAGALQGVAAISQLIQTQINTPSNSANADSSTISPAGQILSQLEQLQQKDPAKLKQVLSQIAQQLNTAAQLNGPGSQGDALARLATRFKSASQTGDLSRLKPRGANGGRFRGAHQAYAQTQQEIGALTNAAQQPGFGSVMRNALTGIANTLKSAIG